MPHTYCRLGGTIYQQQAQHKRCLQSDLDIRLHAVRSLAHPALCLLSAPPLDVHVVHSLVHLLQLALEQVLHRGTGAGGRLLT